MIAIRENGEVYVAGLPEEKLSISNDRQPVQYALTKIDLSKFEVTEETFSDPKVSREIVVHVKQVKIICRFIYDDENAQKVKKSWLKIKYISK